VPDGSRVAVGGLVTHRQRPATAGGTTFLNLEDETGLVNVICSKGVWLRYRKAARSAAALLVRGRLERNEGASNVVADKLEELDLTGAIAASAGGESVGNPAGGREPLAVGRSRDFR
jgi:error-prone DNA polymerase